MEAAQEREDKRNIINYFFLFFNTTSCILCAWYGGIQMDQGVTDLFDPTLATRKMIQSYYYILWGFVLFTFAVVFFLNLLNDLISVLYEWWNLNEAKNLVLKKFD